MIFMARLIERKQPGSHIKKKYVWYIALVCNEQGDKWFFFQDALSVNANLN